MHPTVGKKEKKKRKVHNNIFYQFMSDKFIIIWVVLHCWGILYCSMEMNKNCENNLVCF